MSPFGATILRVWLGVTYIAYAYYLWAIATPDGLAASFNKQTGLPFGDNFVWYVLVAHVFGGLMLVLGFGTRWAVVANLPALMVIVALLQFNEGYYLHPVFADASRSTMKVAGYEYSLFILMATIAQFFLGTGALGFSSEK